MFFTYFQKQALNITWWLLPLHVNCEMLFAFFITFQKCAFFYKILFGGYSYYVLIVKYQMFRKPLNNRTSRPEEFCKQVFLKISKNSEEHTSIRVPFSVKFQVKGCNFIKKRLQRRCFPVKYATFISQNISSGIKSSQTVLLQIIYYDATV